MGPQCEDGYTKIANELLEALATIRIPGESMQLLWVIVRKTYGYGKKEDRISLAQFHDATGIPKPRIIRAVAKMTEMKLVVKSGIGHYPFYGVNKHYEEWEKLPKKAIEVAIEGNAVAIEGNINCHTRHPQKKKETITKEKKERLPICEAWKSFLQMRIKIKKPMTERAMQMAVEKLHVLQTEGHDPIAVLEQSVFKSWSGIFGVKDEKALPARETPSYQKPDYLRGVR